MAVACPFFVFQFLLACPLPLLARQLTSASSRFEKDRFPLRRVNCGRLLGEGHNSPAFPPAPPPSLPDTLPFVVDVEQDGPEEAEPLPNGFPRHHLYRAATMHGLCRQKKKRPQPKHS